MNIVAGLLFVNQLMTHIPLWLNVWIFFSAYRSDCVQKWGLKFTNGVRHYLLVLAITEYMNVPRYLLKLIQEWQINQTLEIQKECWRNWSVCKVICSLAYTRGRGSGRKGSLLLYCSCGRGRRQRTLLSHCSHSRDRRQSQLCCHI